MEDNTLNNTDDVMDNTGFNFDSPNLEGDSSHTQLGNDSTNLPVSPDIDFHSTSCHYYLPISETFPLNQALYAPPLLNQSHYPQEGSVIQGVYSSSSSNDNPPTLQTQNTYPQENEENRVIQGLPPTLFNNSAVPLNEICSPEGHRNGKEVMLQSEDCIEGAQKDSRTKSVKRRFSAEDLSNFSGTIQEAAEEFGVSTTTMKRRCRKLGIKNWKQRKLSNKSQLEVAQIGPQGELTVAPAQIQGELTVEPLAIHTKASYKQEHVRFGLPVTTELTALKTLLVQKLKLKVDTFRIKYKDKDGDWISVYKDSDVKECFKLLLKLGLDSLDLSIQDIEES